MTTRYCVYSLSCLTHRSMTFRTVAVLRNLIFRYLTSTTTASVNFLDFAVKPDSGQRLDNSIVTKHYIIPPIPPIGLAGGFCISICCWNGVCSPALIACNPSAAIASASSGRSPRSSIAAYSAITF